ncbi:MAG: hypothetical protein H0V17_15500 [Deltaproteobacteria bacterium]|nr:hypothetical protein [Deltaproteobacteria bacterium]
MLTLQDTDTNVCSQGVKEVLDNRLTCVIAARVVVVNSIVRATGMLPLVIATTDSLAIQATFGIDASSRFMNETTRDLGAGASTAVCGAAGQGMGGRDGSAGGSFVGRGGDGGTSEMSGGTASSAIAAAFRGGCSGGNSPGTQLGGAGGGVVYLISRTSIGIDGFIAAAGAGGRGGSFGGAGGGSGGYIGIDSPVVSFGAAGLVFATGGGGGGGGCMGSFGQPGANHRHRSTCSGRAG